jgi:hypothetical protein
MLSLLLSSSMKRRLITPSYLLLSEIRIHHHIDWRRGILFNSLLFLFQRASSIPFTGQYSKLQEGDHLKHDDDDLEDNVSDKTKFSSTVEIYDKTHFLPLRKNLNIYHRHL